MLMYMYGWQNLLRGVLRVVRKSRGSPIFRVLLHFYDPGVREVHPLPPWCDEHEPIFSAQNYENLQKLTNFIVLLITKQVSAEKRRLFERQEDWSALWAGAHQVLPVARKKKGPRLAGFGRQLPTTFRSGTLNLPIK